MAIGVGAIDLWQLGIQEITAIAASNMLVRYNSSKSKDLANMLVKLSLILIHSKVWNPKIKHVHITQLLI
jgi:hypothetical protein